MLSPQAPSAARCPARKESPPLVLLRAVQRLALRGPCAHLLAVSMALTPSLCRHATCHIRHEGSGIMEEACGMRDESARARARSEPVQRGLQTLSQTYTICRKRGGERAPSPTLSPTDPVPRGLLTLWARAGMCVCMYELYTHNACSACGQDTLSRTLGCRV